ncbi:hypothetical protein ACQQ2N_03110 [Dokdonella sp. MW10]|uniref:hypothetical protein n=1 Tax=Dokdonella sp. MW10 TaxID=2992926 RepID=UPI003F7F9AF1
MEPLLRVEYFDAAIAIASVPDEAAELRELKDAAVALAEQEDATQRQCIDNRLRAGEKPRRVGAPSSVRSASQRAADEIHALEMRTCRRATSASEIVRSMLVLSLNDTTFNRPLLVYIDLAENKALAEALLDAKDAMQTRFEAFLARREATI